MAKLFALVVLLLAVPAGLLGASPAPVPARVVVLGTETTGDAIVYRLRVVASRRPVMVLLPDDVRLATLEINGVVRQRTGSDVPYGAPPLGHANSTLTLVNLQPADRVSIRVQGSAVVPQFIDDADFVAYGRDIGFGSGAYYAILLTLAFIQLAGFCVLRDPAIAWYLGFTLAMFGLEVARDGGFPSGTNLAWIIVFRTLFTACLGGFSASFLRLRSEAPRLFVASIVANLVPTLSLMAVLAMHRQLALIPLVGLNTAFMLALLVIAVLRRRSGYLPASYLALGLLGVPTMNVVRIVSGVTNTASPFLDRWGLEIGATFDVLFFSIAVLMRVRYSVREHERTQRELVLATFAASHDELTGLLNRRGLEARFEELTSVASTLLFVDLDGFKAINDAGGHAAGDDALKTVARILLSSVRATDIVARVGGDEFVLVLAGSTDAAEIEVVRARISSAVSLVRPLGADDPTRFGVSIGAAQTGAGMPLSDAIATADADTYSAKAKNYAKRIAPLEALMLVEDAVPGKT